MGENFTQIPNELFETELSALEKLVWIVIKKHDWHGNGTWPSIRLIAKEASIHPNSAWRIIYSLKEKGFLSVKKQHGRANNYHLEGVTMRVTQPECHNGGVNCHNGGGGVSQPEVQKKTKEEDSRKRLSTISRKSQIAKSREKAEEALESLDLEKYSVKYPGLHVRAELDKCRDYHLSKQANFHGPKKYTDWGRVFHSWCRNAKERIDARASPSLQSDWRKRFLEKEEK